jgi:SpoIID/LytB domain protein
MFKRGTSLLRLYNRNLNGWPGGSGGARYRGNLRVVRSGGASRVVNHVRLEGYLRGVVPRESPYSWPREALRAQAVAARSYAVRSIKGSGYYDVVCTPASQVYNGYDGEAASTNAAVAATARIVPTYGGKPIVAYFFSTSGGRTENIENVWGGSAVPYLKSVSDPYDYYSRYHTWKDAPYRYSEAAMAKKLGSLARGKLRAVYVTKRGRSPRVVRASVIGTSGARAASGWTLRSRIGLRDTWFSIRSLSISPANSDRPTIIYGQRKTLRGRTYPALGSGKRITLNYYRDGRWRSTLVPLSRTVKKSFTYTLNGSTKRGSYTAYSSVTKPPRTTTYYFSYGKSRSPKMTVRVRPALTISSDATTAQAGDTVTFAGTVRPLTKAGAVIELRRLSEGSWQVVAESTVAADGSYEIPWTAEGGTWSFRARIGAGDQMLANSSAVVTVTVE